MHWSYCSLVLSHQFHLHNGISHTKTAAYWKGSLSFKCIAPPWELQSLPFYWSSREHQSDLPWPAFFHNWYSIWTNELVQDSGNTRVSALELPQSITKPSNYQSGTSCLNICAWLNFAYFFYIFFADDIMLSTRYTENPMLRTCNLIQLHTLYSKPLYAEFYTMKIMMIYA